MERVAVLFGGRSVEHEVSVVTAVQIMENIDKSRYDVLPIYIAKDGVWYSSPSLQRIESFRKEALSQSLAAADIVHWDPIPGHVVRLEPRNAEERRGWFGRPKASAVEWKEVRVDVVIPALHGTYGEDGSVQGFLELTGVPYTSAGVVGSAVGMDKIIMKAVFKGEGIPVVEYDWLTRDDWERKPEEILQRLEERLGYPMFVKPCNLGSSVGISRADHREDLQRALDIAKHYDFRLIVERAVENAIEINVSVLGDECESQVSLCERPISWERFLTYEDKYIRGNFNKSAGSAREIPANLPDAMTKRIQELAQRAFHAVQAKGVVRVDFLVSEANEIYVNEINTIPGSFAFYLWEPTDLPYKDLLTRLIDIAKRSQARRAHNVTTFDTDLLEKFQGQKFAK